MWFRNELSSLAEVSDFIHGSQCLQSVDLRGYLLSTFAVLFLCCSYSEVRQNSVDIMESGCRRNVAVSVAPFGTFSQIVVNKTCLFQSLILKQKKQDKALHQRTGLATLIRSDGLQANRWFCIDQWGHCEFINCVYLKM